MRIETNRLYLWQPLNTDFDDIIEMRNSEFLLQYNPLNLISAGKMREIIKEEMTTEDVFYLELKESGKLIGKVSLDCVKGYRDEIFDDLIYSLLKSEYYK